MVLVKTKQSQSPNASLGHLVAPIQLSLTIGLAEAGPAQTKCPGPNQVTAFDLIGKAHPNINAVASMAWTVVSSTAGASVAPASCNSCTTLPATVYVTNAPATATLRLTVTDTAGCMREEDVVLTVRPPPTCSISG